MKYVGAPIISQFSRRSMALLVRVGSVARGAALMAAAATAIAGCSNPMGSPSSRGTVSVPGPSAPTAAATAAQLSVSGFATPIVSGTSSALTVTAETSGGAKVASYTGTVHFTSSDSAATLPADYTFTSADAGTHVFAGLALNTTGTQSITATDTSSITGTQTGITVQPTPATKLGFATEPSSTGVAGTALGAQPVVQLEDVGGNPISQSGVTVTLSLYGDSGCTSTPIATAPAGGASVLNATAGSSASGLATFSGLSVADAASGLYLKASSGSLVSACSSALSVTAGSASQLLVTAQPSNAGATASISPAVQVTAEDAYGNVASGYSGNVTLAIGTNPSSGTLSGTLTHAAAGGVASFSGLSIDKSGTGYTLSASASGLTSATSSAFNVTVGAATHLVFAVQPANTAATASISPSIQVSAEDAGGNLVTSFTGSVTVAIGTNPSSGLLSGTLTQTASGGIATFSNLSINRAGTGYTLTSASTGLTGATSSAFNINVGAASQLVYSTQPSNAASTAAISPSIQVTAEDAGGNVVTSFAGNVTLAIGTNPSVGTLSGTLTQAASSGVATFGGVSIDKAGTGYTLNATASGLTGAMSGAFNITVGSASKLVFTAQPTNVAPATSISPSVQVSVEDAGGNVVTSSSASITVAIGTNPSAGTLSGTLTHAASSGVATFSNLSINAAGIGYTLTAAATGLTGATSASFTVATGIATHLVFTVQPSDTAATASISPTIQVSAEDAGGNVATSFSGNITLAIGTNAGGGTLSGTLTQAAASGVASFSGVSINAAGTGYTLVATASGLSSGTSASFNVTAGAATQLVFTVQPSSAAATVSVSPSVQVSVEDASGNVVTSSSASITVAIGNNPSSGTLSGTLTRTASSGVATFGGLSINKAGAGYTLSASASGLTGATSGSFAITVGTATQLAVTVQPSNTASTASISPSVQVSVEDAGGNVVTSSSASVTLAIGTNPSSGTLSGTLTGAASGGIASFGNLSINKAGTGYTLTAAATGLTGATSNAFNITVGAATQLAFSVQPSNAVSTSALSPTVQVTVEDAGGNTVTSSSASVTVAIATNAGGGTLSGTLTHAASSGVASFSGISIDKAGTGYTLGASASGLTSGTSNAFNITVGSASQLAFTTQPTNAVSMVALSPSVIVKVEDAGGNVVTSSSASVTVAIGTNPSSGTLSGTLTRAAASGIATFNNLSVNKAGVGYTLTGASSGLATATSSGFNITVGAASQLAFSSQPTATTGGTAFSPDVQVSVEDAGGNVVTSSSVSVAVAIGTNPSAGTLSGTLTVAASSGVADFAGISLNAAGAGYTLTAAATGLTGATSSAFNVTVGAATQLAFTAQPSNTVSTAAIAPSVSVTAEDAGGNVVTGYSGNVTIAVGSNPSGGNLSGTLTIAALTGVSSFTDLSIDLVGTGYTLSATAPGLTSATSSGFNITVGAAAQLTFTAQPVDTAATLSISPAVQVSVQDAGGNVVTSSSVSVTVAIGNNPSTGTLSGTLTQSASSGVASFSNLSINTVGSGYTFTATATGLSSGGSASFNVVPGTATQLVFSQQPTNTVAGGPFIPPVQVTAEDAGGNIATGFSGNITVAIGTNPGGGTLSGTPTVAASSGVASFTDLSINSAGSGYTLTASSTGLTGVTSTSFNMTADQLIFTTQPSSTAVAGAALGTQPKVSVESGAGAVITTSSAAITLAAYTNSTCTTAATGTFGVTTNPLNAASGVAIFAGVSYTKAQTIYIGASSPGMASGCSSAVAVGAAAATQLAFTTQPPFDAFTGMAYVKQPVVTLEDQYGNLETTGSNSVTLAAYSDSGCTAAAAGTLGVTSNPLSASSGVATFAGATYTGAQGTVYLKATASGLTSSCSTATNVLVGRPIATDSQSTFACALSSGGNVYCWGSNADGQIGNNTTTTQKEPVEVLGAGGTGNLSSVSEIAVGDLHTCGVSGGNVYCWGDNADGQLGINSTTSKSTPVEVLGVGGTGNLSGIVSVGAGQLHTCAVSGAGNVYCWGYNAKGQLGNNTTTEENVPVEVLGVGGTGVLSGIVSVTAGYYNTCALAGTGNVYCWGYNNEGQLGNNTTTTEKAPVEVLGVGGTGFLGNIVALSSGEYHTCAVSSVGNVYCWGYDNDGQIGQNSTTTYKVPIEVLGVGGTGNLSGIVGIGTGQDSACAVSSAGNVYCWGLGTKGEMGNNATTTEKVPVEVLGVGGAGNLSGAQWVTAGAAFGCAATAGGNVYCWGLDSSGQLGNNSTTEVNTPVEVLGVGGVGDLSGI